MDDWADQTEDWEHQHGETPEQELERLSKKEDLSRVEQMRRIALMAERQAKQDFDDLNTEIKDGMDKDVQTTILQELRDDEQRYINLIRYAQKNNQQIPECVTDVEKYWKDENDHFQQIPSRRNLDNKRAAVKEAQAAVQEAQARRQEKRHRIEQRKEASESYREKLQAWLTSEILSQSSHNTDDSSEPKKCALLQIENTITWLIDNQKKTNQDDSTKQTKQKEIMLYFFLGYLPENPARMVGLLPINTWEGNDGMQTVYWSKYWDDTKIAAAKKSQNQKQHKDALFEEYAKPIKTVSDFFTRTSLTDLNLRQKLKDTLRNICVTYWRNYYNKGGPRAKWPKREFPEFEYWLWSVLETLTGGENEQNLLKNFGIERFYNEDEKLKNGRRQVGKKKPLGLQTVKTEFEGIQKTIATNIEQVFKYYCDKNFKAPEPLPDWWQAEMKAHAHAYAQYSTKNDFKPKCYPFTVLFVYILFNYDLLYEYLNMVYAGVLYDPTKTENWNLSTAQYQNRVDNIVKNQTKKEHETRNLIFTLDFANMPRLVHSVLRESGIMNWKKVAQENKSIYNSFAIKFPQDMVTSRFAFRQPAEDLCYYKKKYPDDQGTLFEQLDKFTERTYAQSLPELQQGENREFRHLRHLLILALDHMLETEEKAELLEAGKWNFFNDAYSPISKSFAGTLVKHDCLTSKTYTDVWMVQANENKDVVEAKHWNFRRTVQAFQHKLLFSRDAQLQSGEFLMLPWIAVCLWTTIYFVVLEPSSALAGDTPEQLSENVKADIETLQTAANSEAENTSEVQTAWILLDEKKKGFKYDGKSKFSGDKQVHNIFILWERNSFNPSFYDLEKSDKKEFEVSNKKCEIAAENKKTAELQAAQAADDAAKQDYIEEVDSWFWLSFRNDDIVGDAQKTEFLNDLSYSTETKYMLTCGYQEWNDFASRRRTINTSDNYLRNPILQDEELTKIQSNFEESFILKILYALTARSTFHEKIAFLKAMGKTKLHCQDDFSKIFVQNILNIQEFTYYFNIIYDKKYPPEKYPKKAFDKIQYFWPIVVIVVSFWSRSCVDEALQEQWKKWLQRSIGDNLAKMLQESEDYKFIRFFPGNNLFVTREWQIKYGDTIDLILNCGTENQQQGDFPERYVKRLQATQKAWESEQDAVQKKLPVAQEGASTLTQFEDVPVWPLAAPLSAPSVPSAPFTDIVIVDIYTTRITRKTTSAPSGKDVTELPNFADLLDSIMRIVEKRGVKVKGAPPDKIANEALLVSIFTELHKWIFSEDNIGKSFVNQWCKNEIQNYYRNPKKSILNDIYCNIRKKPRKADFEALKVHVINISSTVLAQAARINKPAWKRWIFEQIHITETIEFETAIRLLKEQNDSQNPLQNTYQLLVTTILLDDHKRKEFMNRLQETIKHMPEPFGVFKQRRHSPNFPDVDLALIQEEQTEDYFLLPNEITFETQQDAHSLFAAVAQVLYNYTAFYNTGKQVHYSDNTFEARILRQHINELRYAVAWMSLQHTRAAARNDAWYKHQFGNLMIHSLSDMWKHYENMLYYAQVNQKHEDIPSKHWGTSYAIQLLADYIERPICVYYTTEKTNFHVSTKYELHRTYQPLVAKHNPAYSPLLLVRDKKEEHDKTHYNVIVLMVDDGHWQVEREEWQKNHSVRKIMRLFQQYVCLPFTYTFTYTFTGELSQKTLLQQIFPTRKWDNIFEQLLQQIIDLRDTHYLPSEKQRNIKTQLWKLLNDLAMKAEAENDGLLDIIYEDPTKKQTGRRWATLIHTLLIFESFLGRRVSDARIPNLHFFYYQPAANDNDTLVFFHAVRFAEWIYEQFETLFPQEPQEKRYWQKVTGMFICDEFQDKTKSELQFQFDAWLNANDKFVMDFTDYLDKKCTITLVSAPIRQFLNLSPLEQVPPATWREYLRQCFNEAKEALNHLQWEPTEDKTDLDVSRAQEQLNFQIPDQFEYAKTHPASAQETQLTLDVQTLASTLKQKLQQAEELCLVEEDTEDMQEDSDEKLHEHQTAVQMQLSTHANNNFRTDIRWEEKTLGMPVEVDGKPFRRLIIDGDGNCFFYICWLFSLSAATLKEKLKLMQTNAELFLSEAKTGQQGCRHNIHNWIKDHAADITSTSATVKDSCIFEYDDTQKEKVLLQAQVDFEAINAIISTAHYPRQKQENIDRFLQELLKTPVNNPDPQTRARRCKALLNEMKKKKSVIAGVNNKLQTYLTENPITDDDDNKKFDFYLEMIKMGDWGGHICALAFAKFYDKHVIIHRKDGILGFNSDPDSQKEAVYFEYNGTDHYDALIPIDFESNVYDRPAPEIEPPPAYPEPEPPAPAHPEHTKQTRRLLTPEMAESKRRSLIYQAFTDLICFIFKAKKAHHLEMIETMAKDISDFTIIKQWKDVLEQVSVEWQEIIKLFASVCDQAHYDWPREQRNYDWTAAENLKEIKKINEQNEDEYYYLPYFEIYFYDKTNNDKCINNEKSFISHYKAIFWNQSKRWFDRLRRQIMELWMQEIFKKFPIEGITDAKKSPYFELKLSKQEIANFAEGLPDEHGHRYCLPANCYKQLDENNMDVSLDKAVNPELWKFRDKFFSNDVNKDGTPVVSKLCVALFRLRKICAFIRKAHEYEIVDEEGKTSGNTAKIQELRESIIQGDDQSKFVLVQAANMQRCISEFVV